MGWRAGYGADWMTGAEIMAVVGFMVMLFGAVAAFWYRLHGGIEKNRADLADHKIHVAETDVTKAGMWPPTLFR